MKEKKVPIGELCEQALKHYEEISDRCSHYNSLIPEAIKFYQQHHEEPTKITEKELPNHCGTVVGGLDDEILRQIILEEISRNNRKKLMFWFELAICGAELTVVDGVGP